MSSMKILGSIPILRDYLQMPAIRKDGGVQYITPRQALEMERGIEKKNKNAFSNPDVKSNPSIAEMFHNFTSFLRKFI